MKASHSRQHTKGLKKALREERKRIDRLLHKLCSLNPTSKEKQQILSTLREWVGKGR